MKKTAGSKKKIFSGKLPPWLWVVGISLLTVGIHSLLSLIGEHSPAIPLMVGAVLGCFLYVYTKKHRDHVRGLHRASAQVKKSEAKYRTFFENSTDAMLIIENGEFVDCNEAAVAMLGYNQKGEVIHQHPSRLSPEFQPDGQSSVEKADEMMRLAVERGGCRFEWAHLRKDGVAFPVEVSLTAIEMAEGMQLHTVWRDLTERKQVEKELVDSESRFKVLHNATFGGIAIHDKGRILDCNRGLEELSGYSTDELIGMDGLLLIAESMRELVMSKILSGDEIPYEAIGLRKNGEEYPLRLAARNIPYKGKDVRVVEFRDITGRKELEEQLRQAQKMEAVGQMAGGIAHDFNNLLQVIGGYAELSQMNLTPDDPLAPAIREIEKAARRGKGLINQLLAFSRRQVIRPVDLNLNETIHPLLNMIRGLIGEHIELEFIEGRDPGTVYADHGLIGQVLMNLCVNARDAMPEGGKLTIETKNVLINSADVRTHSWARAGRYVLLSVTDIGCGMDQKTLAQIFEPFFTTKEVGKGTGLGLSMAFGIVKQHGGHIAAYSEVNCGTVFEIYLPVVERDVSEPFDSATGPVVGGTETILIAEDDEMVLRLAERMLSRAGYTVLAGRDGEEALRLFEKHADQIDLVMMDVVMPRMGGKEAMDQILKLRPGTAHLFASGYSENVVHTNFIQEHGLHLLRKPYQNESLLRTVREVIDSASE